MSSITWPAPVDGILAGDHVVALAYATPAGGTVILPLTNFGVRDRRAGTVTVNSSVGVPKKLERIRANPKVALAFHTRAHATHDRPQYVLAQGDAVISDPVEDYPSTMLEEWERFEPWTDRAPFWRWWQRIYGTRVGIVMEVRRMVVWDDLSCRGAPTVLGDALTGGPPPQRPPKKGTGPRLGSRRVARRAAKVPHALLGWIGADGYPMVGPVAVSGASEEGVRLTAPPGLVPPGARRAGLTAHAFGEGVVSQEQHKHTGWLEPASPGEFLYAPHTDSSYRMPDSRLVYRLVTGAATRQGVRAARRAGLMG